MEKLPNPLDDKELPAPHDMQLTQQSTINQQQLTPLPPAQPQVVKPTSPIPLHKYNTGKGKWLIVLLALFFALLLIGAGIYLINVKAEEFRTQALSLTPTLVLSPTPTPDPSANWSIYSATDISLKYPPTAYTLTEEKTKGVQFQYGAMLQDTMFDNAFPLYINVWGKPKTALTKDSIQTWCNNLGSEAVKHNMLCSFLSSAALQQVILDGKTAYIASYYTSDTTKIQLYIVEGDNAIVTLVVTNQSEADKNPKHAIAQTTSQILSTFKFLDTSTSPTCIPRPACLDATPRCLIPESENMCKSSITPPQQVACTQEAKLCPDGSYVSRTGPNCEFTACPN